MPVSDAELCQGLSAALGERVHAVERRPWAYHSSGPAEVLVVAGHPPMLFKDLGAGRHSSRPAFLLDPLREIEAYSSLLAGPADAPACLGHLVDGDRVWLFLEIVDGIPLWQADMAAWRAAARWLARMHSVGLPQGSHLLRHDAAHLQRWVDRAVAMAPAQGLDPVRDAACRAVGRLAEWPAAFVHGEFYPSNVLVQEAVAGPRIRPVDWETAGVGPGLLDLAALTSGEWDPARRASIVGAYRDALPAVAPGFDEALAAARLIVSLQWLGWSDTWSPPPEHAYDWAGEAHALAHGMTA